MWADKGIWLDMATCARRNRVAGTQADVKTTDCGLGTTTLKHVSEPQVVSWAVCWDAKGPSFLS